MSKRKPHSRSIVQAMIVAEHFNYLCRAGLSGEKHTTRIDADETAMLALQLEDMRTRVFAEEFEELKARRFLPVTNEVDSGAETFSYEETSEVGEAGIVTNYADDFKTVEVSGTKRTHSVVSIGVAYTYSIQDIRRAAFSGRPLSARKAQNARKAFERKVDSIAAFGSPDEGIPQGFLNHASVAIEPLAAAGAWSTKTATQKLADLNALSRAVIEDSKEVYAPNRLLMPLGLYLDASHTRMSVDNAETVLEAFLRANSWIEDVQPWNKLSTAGASGVSRMVAYRFDSDIAEIVNPQEFEVMPPQPKNLAFVVNCHGRTAGCVVHRPLGVKYMDGA